MNISLIIILLASLTALFSALAAGMGLFFRKTGSPYFYQSLRGTKVQIYGQGLYRYDTLFFGAGFKGQDTAALFRGCSSVDICNPNVYTRFSRGSPAFIGLARIFPLPLCFYGFWGIL